jgi:DNA polymerase-1
MPSPALLLVDGHALAYRQFFALERTAMATSTGQPSWTAYGFFSALQGVLQAYQPQALAFAFDVARESFRTELYPEYKAHRQAMPDTMRAQMSGLLEGIASLGLPLYQVPNFEADDVIGTLSTQAAAQGWDVLVLTGDQDAFQLVDEAGRIRILIPGRTPKDPMKAYDSQAVYDKWQVWPHQVADYKGLMGDSSDNIPGVPGVGPKTAAQLLNQYATLEQVLAHIADVPKAGLQAKLTEHTELAKLSKVLATINTAVPSVTFDPQACQLASLNQVALKTLFEAYEFKRLLGQWPLWVSLLTGEPPTYPALEAEFTAATPEEANNDQAPPLPTLSWVEPTLITDLDTLQHHLAQALQAGVVAFDVETTGLDTLTAQPVGFSIAYGEGLRLGQRTPANPLGLSDASLPEWALVGEPHPNAVAQVVAYVPMAHSFLGDALTAQQCPWESVAPLLQPLLASEQVVKLIHNVKYEYKVLKQWGVTLAGPVFDTMLASFVCQPEGKHGLKTLATTQLGLHMTPIEDLIGKGKKQTTFDKVPIEQATPYGAADADATWRLAHRFTQVLQAEPTLATLFYELENPLATVLADMETVGIRLDTAHLEGLRQRLAGELATQEADILALAGGDPFNLNSPKQVGEVLFDRLGIKPLRKTAGKTAYSTDASVLEYLAPDYPIVQRLLDYRQTFKLQSTYVEALPRLLHPLTGRIHTSFNQTIAATGRLSSSDPNLQNIPIRTTTGRLLRQAFVPGSQDKTQPHGGEWWLLSADYSQIELRVLAHFSQEPRLMEAFASGLDVHAATAALVFGVPVEQVSKHQRYQAKTVNFGVVYGQTAHGLSQQLGVTRAEAQAFIDEYFTLYPQVKAFIEATKAQAHEQGYVTTLYGRRRNLAEGLNASNKSMREFAERAAFNTPLQGGAADVMKAAMLALAHRLKQANASPYARLLLQVHDELVLEVHETHKATVEAWVREAMLLQQPLRVPLEVDCQWGQSWLEGE